MNYKVSIILPVYNVEKFLKKCLDSILNQTLKEIEIVAVNDCSTDHSLEILHDYKQLYGDRIQIYNTGINVKQGGARNLGISKARGEYLGFVDPDDYIAKEMFEKMYTSAVETSSDIVTCDYYEVIGDKQIYKVNDIPEGIIDNNLKRKILQRKYGWELWQQLYKRDLFIDNSIKFSENLYVTDLEIGALLFMYANKVTKVKKALYYYVKHDKATTSFKLNDNKVYDLITVSDLRLRHFKDRGFYSEFKEEIDYIYFWHICIVSIPRCVINFSKPQIHKMEELKKKVLEKIPNIKENRYYKESNFFNKLVFNLLLKNKYILIALLKIIKIIPLSFRNKIKVLIRK